MSDKTTGWPLNVQVIVKGKSPEETIHWTDATCSDCIGSEPKLNGTTVGGAKMSKRVG